MRRTKVLLQTLDVVLRRIAGLQPSLRADELRTAAEGIRAEARGWHATPPSVAEGERVMKRVLALHVEVAKLEQSS